MITLLHDIICYIACCNNLVRSRLHSVNILNLLNYYILFHKSTGNDMQVVTSKLKIEIESHDLFHQIS